MKKKDISNLKVGDTLSFDVSNDYIMLLQIQGDQLIAYENLFKSYINNTTEEANNFNLQKFLDKYTLLTAQKIAVQVEAVKGSVGTEYDILEKNYGYMYNIDLASSKLDIVIKVMKEDK